MKTLLPCLLLAFSVIGCKKGDSLSNQPNYTNVKILHLTVTGMPFTTTNGGGWDASNGPDVYFTIKDPLGNKLITAPTFDNVTQSQLPMTWNFTQAFLITNLSTRYSFDLFDYDFPSADDFIGGYTFALNDYKSGYPKVITIKSPTSSINLELTVEWY